jgi:hypothetical protein
MASKASAADGRAAPASSPLSVVVTASHCSRLQEAATSGAKRGCVMPATTSA